MSVTTHDTLRSRAISDVGHGEPSVTKVSLDGGETSAGSGDATSKPVAKMKLARTPAHGRPRRPSSRKWITRAVLLVLVGAGLSQVPRLTQKKPVLVKTVRVERATV